jgi:hypothetical protein
VRQVRLRHAPDDPGLGRGAAARRRVASDAGIRRFPAIAKQSHKFLRKRETLADIQV